MSPSILGNWSFSRITCGWLAISCSQLQYLLWIVISNEGKTWPNPRLRILNSLQPHGQQVNKVSLQNMKKNYVNSQKHFYSFARLFSTAFKSTSLSTVFSLVLVFPLFTATAVVLLLYIYVALYYLFVYFSYFS